MNIVVSSDDNSTQVKTGVSNFNIGRNADSVYIYFEFEGKRKDTSLVIMRSFQYFCEYRRQLFEIAVIYEYKYSKFDTNVLMW